MLSWLWPPAASLVQRLPATGRRFPRGGTVVVASGDRDAFQLASNRTTILQPVRASEMARIGPAEVLERYGVEPGQVPDFIALRGDPRTSCGDIVVGARGSGKPRTHSSRFDQSWWRRECAP